MAVCSSDGIQDQKDFELIGNRGSNEYQLYTRYMKLTKHEAMQYSILFMGTGKWKYDLVLIIAFMKQLMDGQQ